MGDDGKSLRSDVPELHQDVQKEIPVGVWKVIILRLEGDPESNFPGIPGVSERSVIARIIVHALDLKRRKPCQNIVFGKS